jgi:hypothetical protein
MPGSGRTARLVMIIVLIVVIAGLVAGELAMTANVGR